MAPDLWEKLLLRLRQIAKQTCAQGYTELPITLVLDQGKLVGWRVSPVEHWEPDHMAERIARGRQNLT